jgi:hypothetical protein
MLLSIVVVPSSSSTNSSKFFKSKITVINEESKKYDEKVQNTTQHSEFLHQQEIRIFSWCAPVHDSSATVKLLYSVIHAILIISIQITSG